MSAPRVWARTPLDHVDAPSGDIDTDHDQDELIDELWGRPGTLVLPMRLGAALADEDGRLALLPPQEIDALAEVRPGDDELRLYLGRVTPSEGIPGDGILTAHGSGPAPVIAAMLDDGTADRVRRGTWTSLRELAGALDPRDLGLLTRATALANWHASHRFSPASGRPTQISKAGWVRVDAADGSEHFPRTDPAVIIAVTDFDERILLGSNMAWDQRMFSLIAGFVDPGESLETAVIREVKEETGLTVVDPLYLGSQPWPFPASLMLGFSAVVDDRSDAASALRPDGHEIRALRWFSRAELRDACKTGEIYIPQRGSIARSIIEAWFGETITVDKAT